MNRIGFIILVIITSIGFTLIYSLIGSLLTILLAPPHAGYDYGGGYGLWVVFYFIISVIFNFITFLSGTLIEKKNNPSASYLPNKKIHIFLVTGNLIVVYLPSIL